MPPISELHMSKSTKLVVLGLSFLLASFVVVGGLGVKANTNDDGSYRQLGVYSEVLSRIRTEYVEEPNMPAVTNGALHGLLESLDANSSYLDPGGVQGLQAAQGRQGRHWRGDLEALWLCSGDLGDSGRAGGQGGNRQRRHHRGDRGQVHARHVAGRD